MIASAWSRWGATLTSSTIRRKVSSIPLLLGRRLLSPDRSRRPVHRRRCFSASHLWSGTGRRCAVASDRATYRIAAVSSVNRRGVAGGDTRYHDFVTSNEVPAWGLAGEPDSLGLATPPAA